MALMMEQPHADHVLSGRDLARNRVAFFLDMVLFGAGLTFAGTTTTLPAFAARLTDNPLWIGWISVIWSGSWLIPQIAAAHYLAPLPQKRPVAILLAWIGRPAFAAFAIFLFLGGAIQPMLALGALFLVVFLFSFTDSIVGVAFFDMLARSLPGRERGRVLGLAQIGGGILSVGAGIVIRLILENPAVPFPNNYAYLFLMADVCFLLSLAAFYFIREPADPSTAKRQKWSEYLPSLWAILRTDAAFRQVNLARLFVGFSAAAAPFFVVFALHHAGLRESDVGIFTAAQTLGGTAAGFLFGWMADAIGSHRVIRATGVVYLLAPLLALGSNFWLGNTQLVTICFAAIFFFIGMGDGAIMLGFINYVLDMAPPGKRPAYIGLTNTLMGITIAYPLIGGWLAGWAGYNAVFFLAFAGILTGWIASWRLPDPRRHASAS
jgi:MFS family permease